MWITYIADPVCGNNIQEGSDAHIETKAGRVDHSTAGAQHAFKSSGDRGKLLAYAIAGHHAGLLDGKSNDACLHDRLKKTIPDYSSCPEHIIKTKSLGNLSRGQNRRCENV